MRDEIRAKCQHLISLSGDIHLAGDAGAQRVIICKVNICAEWRKLTFSCLKRVRILISRNVRWQYVWCSKGEIFLMATRVFVSSSVADLHTHTDNDNGNHSVSTVLILDEQQYSSKIDAAWIFFGGTNTKIRRIFHFAARWQRQRTTYESFMSSSIIRINLLPMNKMFGKQQLCVGDRRHRRREQGFLERRQWHGMINSRDMGERAMLLDTPRCPEPKMTGPAYLSMSEGWGCVSLHSQWSSIHNLFMWLI